MRLLEWTAWGPARALPSPLSLSGGGALVRVSLVPGISDSQYPGSCRSLPCSRRVSCARGPPSGGR